MSFSIKMVFWGLKHLYWENWDYTGIICFQYKEHYLDGIPQKKMFFLKKPAITFD
jgi:hypothetical protein